MTLAETNDHDPGQAVAGSARGQKKALAAKAGISTRTLRRMEKGEGVSVETRRRVLDAVATAPETESDPLRETHLAALRLLGQDHSTRSDRIGDYFVFAPFGFGSAAVLYGLLLADRDGSFLSAPKSGLGILVMALVLMTVTSLIHSVRHLRRWKTLRELKEENEARQAPVVIEGIRYGSIKYLTPRQRSILIRTLGERVLGGAMRAAPRRVQFLSEPRRR